MKTLPPHLQTLVAADPRYAALFAAQGYAAETQPITLPTCLHRGELLRHVPCRPCQGSRLIPLYSCRHTDKKGDLTYEQCTPFDADVHFRDSLGLDDVAQVCRTCPHRDLSNMLAQITACVTHHMRPDSLTRLLASVKRYYPTLAVDVDDTNGNLSASRNRLAARCQTPYYLMLEEDFVFTEKTRLEDLYSVLHNHPELHGAGGLTWEPAIDGTDGRGRVIGWRHCFSRIRDRIHLIESARPPIVTDGVRFHPCDLILNFGLFRTKSLQALPWDEKLPVQEHTDWFYQAYRDASGHFAHVPSVTIDHIRDRPSPQYRRDRNRNFSAYLREKWQASFVDDSQKAELAVPNVVILSVGRSNSTIVTKMAAHAFRLNVGNIDPQFYEHRTVRQINEAVWQGGAFDTLQARRVLRSLPQPWIIKDPRFRRTFQFWQGPLREFDPVVVLLEKSPETVAASYAKQGWPYDPADHQRVEEAFARWPGRKLRVNAEDIGIAAGMFDFGRLKLATNREHDAAPA